MGCTHYPLLEHVIADVMGDKVTLVNSGEETAHVAYEALTKSNLLNMPGIAVTVQRASINSSSPTSRTSSLQVATRFLGELVDNITRVDISRY